MHHDERRSAVVGAGQMGADIAGLMASSGSRVTIADATPEMARSAEERLLREAGPGARSIEARIECHDSIEDACRDARYVKEDQDVEREVLALLDELEKVPAVVAASPGFVANRLQFALVREAHLMLGEGLASAEENNTVVSNSFGLRLSAFGPFLIGDMAGLGVYAGAYRTLEDAYGERLSAPQTVADAVAGGRVGLKSGQGLLGAYSPESRDELLALRDEAYATLRRFRQELPCPGDDIHRTNDNRTSEETS